MAKRKRNRKTTTVSASGGPVVGALANGLSHPTRAEILAFLIEQEIASPSEMCKAGLGRNSAGDAKKKKLPHISYHVRVLADFGLIRLVYSRSVRGATEHFYEPVAGMMLDVEEWSKLPARAKNDVSIRALEETLGLAGKAVSAGTLDSYAERAIINLGLRLDEEGYLQLADDITELMRRCERVQGEALQRVEGDMEKLMHASASLLLYESPAPERPRGD